VLGFICCARCVDSRRLSLTRTVAWCQLAQRPAAPTASPRRDPRQQVAERAHGRSRISSAVHKVQVLVATDIAARASTSGAAAGRQPRAAARPGRLRPPHRPHGRAV
jgi:hypothetical protein